MHKSVFLSVFVATVFLFGSSAHAAHISHLSYSRYIPPEILSAFDPSVVEGKRPSFHQIGNSDIWSLRENPVFEADWVQPGYNFRIDEMTLLQKEILINWVKNGGKLYVKEASAVKLFFPGVSGHEYYPLQEGMLYLNKEHPVCRDVEKFQARWDFVLENLPAQAVVLAGTNPELTQGVAVLFPYGKGKIFFCANLYYTVRSYSIARFSLNLNQFTAGEPVPDITLSKVHKQFKASQKAVEEEKKAPVSLGKKILTNSMLTIEKAEDLNNIYLLEKKPSPADIVSVRAPRKIVPAQNLETITDWVRKGGVLLIWVKPEYIMDERLGFVGEYFGVQAGESDKNIGDVVAEVTPRCIIDSLNQRVKKVMVSIPVYQGKGYSYQDGFNYILLEREDEPISVVKKEGKGYIVALPWSVNKEFFDGGIFWKNLIRTAETSETIGSIDIIKKQNGTTVRAVVLRLTDSHLFLSKDEKTLSQLLPLSEVQYIATRNYLLSEKIKQTAPWIEVITPGKATSP